MWLIYAVTAAAVWGLDYSLCERIFACRVSPVVLLFFQMVAGALVFLPFVLRSTERAEVGLIAGNPLLLKLVAGSIVTAVLGGLFVSFAIQSKNATLSSLVEICYPLFTVLATWLFFHVNHITPAVIIGGIFIMAGILVISL